MLLFTNLSVTLIYKRPLQMDTTLLANNPQYCWMLHVLSVYTPCCVSWGDVAYVWNQSNFLPHANRRNIVNCCVHLHIAISVSCGVWEAFSRLCSGGLCRLRHTDSYREPYFFALNLKYFWRTFMAQITLSQLIVTQFCTISFSVFSLPFFYSSALSVFVIKMKIECKGD